MSTQESYLVGILDPESDFWSFRCRRDFSHLGSDMKKQKDTGLNTGCVIVMAIIRKTGLFFFSSYLQFISLISFLFLPLKTMSSVNVENNTS